jgi:hypothetical protein
MKRLLLLIFIFLTACGSPTTAPASTVDPFIALEQARQTNEASSNEVALLSSQLTSTAEAPIIAMTQRAADLSYEQTLTADARTSTAISWTATPSSTPTVIPTATPNITATIAVIEVQGTQQSAALAIDRERSTNTMRAIAVYVFGFVMLILLAMFGIVGARRLAISHTQTDERGKPRGIIDVINGVVIDTDRLTNGAGSLKPSYFKQLPEITASRQDATTARAQSVDMHTRRASPAIKKLLTDQGALPAAALQFPDHDRFLLPDWELVNGWDGTKGIPYYTAGGLDFIDINQYPHLSVIGMTGSRKSRGFLRPYIACALAAGHKVVIIGKSADYWPFESHPNAKLLTINKITEPGQAMRYRDILQKIVEEMNHRDDVLTGLHQSTWMHAGRQRTIIVLDELGNALRIMRQLNAEYANQSMAWIEVLVSEGRKVGFNILIANQRATGMSSILSQTGKAIFRVEPDEEKAHRSLTGASDLKEGYFLAKFGASKLAGAFEPTDDQLITFLASRPVPTLEQDGWIDADVSEQQQLSVQPASESLPEPQAVSEPDARVIELAEKIKDQWTPDLSGNKIAAMLGFSQYGGSYKRRVDEVIKYLTSTTTTGTEGLPEAF